jgi:heme/copper-type cytochrome/quinol oxidase subunit 2
MAQLLAETFGSKYGILYILLTFAIIFIPVVITTVFFIIKTRRKNRKGKKVASI